MLSQIDELPSHYQRLFNIAQRDVELIKHGVPVSIQPPLAAVSVRTTLRSHVGVQHTQYSADVTIQLQ